MKKLLLVGLLFLFITGCSREEEKTCDEGYELRGSLCYAVEVATCETGYEMIAGECKEMDECGTNEQFVDGVCIPTSQSNRTLVPEGCSYLANIGDWQPVWCDEFNGEGIPDSESWGYDFGPNWPDYQEQYYTYQNEDNVFQNDGTLKIKADFEFFGGKFYTSARINNRYSGDILYGKIQVRAKLPGGEGPLSEIWLAPTHNVNGSWPYSGEIRIVEHHGVHDYVNQSVTNGAFNSYTDQYIYQLTPIEDLKDEFHLYELEWEPGIITYYIDGEEIYQYAYDKDLHEDIPVLDAWPFDTEFYLIMNVAVRGFPNIDDVDYETFPQEMEIDYVRVYQKDYEGMDITNPTSPSNLVTLERGKNTLRVAWDKATDDVMVKGYNVYVDGVFYQMTSVNAIDIYDLEFSTEYEIAVETVDFAGRTSSLAIDFFLTQNNVYTGGKIEAEDYTDMSGIQTEATSDLGTGLNVGWVDDGDYLTYRLNISEAGYYRVDYRVASNWNGGVIELYTDDDLLTTTSFDTTNGWQNWVTVQSDLIYLEAGLQTFKLLFTQDGCNINYFEFRRVN